jgi:hypothetical protein
VKTAGGSEPTGRPQMAAKGQSGKMDASTQVRQSDKERGSTPAAAMGPSGKFWQLSPLRKEFTRL